MIAASPPRPHHLHGALRLAARIGLTLCLAGLLSACDSGPSVEDHLERATQFEREGDFRSFVIELKRVLQAAPDSATARWLLGKTYVRLGLGPAATKELERAARLGFESPDLLPQQVEALLLTRDFEAALEVTEEAASESNAALLLTLRGEAALASERHELAEAAFSAALEREPGTARALVGLAELAQVRGNLAARHRYLEQALQDRTSIEALVFKANVAFSSGEFEAARDDFEAALALSDGYVTALSRAAYAGATQARLALGDADGAEPHIEALQKAFPDLPVTRYLRALSHRVQGETEKAKLTLRDILKGSPDHAYSLVLLGTLHYEAQEYEQARAMLVRAIANSPAFDQARRALAAVYLRIDEPATAANVLAPAVERSPDDPELQALLGAAYVGSGQYAEAVQHLEKAVELAPQSGEVRAQLAVSRTFAGDEVRGLQGLEASVEVDPDYATGHELLIYNYLHRQDYNSALEAALAFVAAHADNAVAHNLIGVTYQRRGDDARARQHYDKALGLDAGHVAALANLAALDIQDGKPQDARARYTRIMELPDAESPAQVFAALQLVQLDTQAGDSGAAERHYRYVLEREPTHLAALINLASIAGKSGRQAEGLTLLERAREAHPDAVEPRLILAQVYVETNRPLDALPLLEAVRRAAPDNAPALRLLGTAHIRLRQFEQAVEVLRHLVRAVPSDAQALVRLGGAQDLAGDAAAARASFERAVELGAPKEVVAVALGDSLLGTREFDAAVRLAERILRDAPQFAPAYGMLGDAHTGMGEYEKARLAYEKALELAPDDYAVAAMNNLASLNFLEDRTDAATAGYRKVLERDPDNRTALLNLATLAVRVDDTDAARSHLQTVLDANPNDVDALVLLARAEGQGGNMGRAFELLERARAASPAAVEPRMTLLANYVVAGQLERAREVGRELKRIAPGAPSVLRALGNLEIAQDQPREALTLFGRWVRQQPESSDAHYHLGFAHLAAGEIDAARAELNAALELDPDNAQARVELGRLALEDGKLDEALRHAETVQTALPGFSDGYLLAGDAHLRAQRPGAAVKSFFAAHAAQPSRVTLMRLVQAHIANADNAAAYQELLDWLRDRDDPAARLLLADVYQRTGATQRAIEAYEATLAADPHSYPALNNLALLYLEQDDPRAVEVAEKLQEMAPDIPLHMDTIGWVLINHGQLERGIGLLEKVVGAGDAGPERRYHLAVGLARAGDVDGARRQLRAALESDAPFAGRADAEQMLSKLR